ncbi:LacI family DNA-binding transcriptional regulator [Sphaerisporangium sp. TRM90804]|uniref:LacI family DNA-binding transcriptional regulator n=1 Tax=Sphaerisporangium sp. TRM90804 TaxID=3031113 RepID=UPI00244BC3EC|nr:LacI family DNA-binding transcriptional regulator [Sphaerisporangium sp. TRM90804]MDH2426570.1 LacI family DNA-binding transcriptional regulator [Sphaerisporangium sp. TRM90804]
MARPGTRATVRDVAAETGLSIATVSRVLNGQANVAPHTRELVLRAVGRLGDQAPRPRTGEGLARGAVYVRCPYLLTDYFGLIVSSVGETIELHGGQMILGTGESAQHTPVLAGLPDRPGIAGAILILPPEPAGELVRLRDRQFPFVVIDPSTSPPKDIVAVSAAHFAGARKLMAHVVELGHRRVGIMGGPPEWLPSEARLAGYTASLADAGVLPSAELLRSAPEPNTEHGYRAACELLDLPERPTALVAFNDKMAVGALWAAAERGLSVPGDLSVAGFDDIDLSRATLPMLTTVRQPLQEMGRMGVTLLMRLLSRHRLEALHVSLGTELIVRGSTGPAPH